LINILEGGNVPPDHTERKRKPEVGRNISTAKLAKQFHHKQETKDKIRKKLNGRVGKNKGYTQETHLGIKRWADKRRGQKRDPKIGMKAGLKLRGQKKSREYKEGCRQRQKERCKNGYKPPVHCRKVYEYSKDLTHYKEWPSILSLMIHYTVSRGTIIQWAKKGYCPKDKEKLISLINPKK
jgi:hypothetical protein